MTAARRLAVLRVTLALVAVADLFSYYGFITEARADALLNGVVLGGLTDLVSRPPLTALLVFVGVAAALRLARAAGRVWAGSTTLAVLALLGTVHGQLYGSPWRHLFFSGLCLAGWLLGLAASRRRGAPGDESYAAVGSLALLGAAYLSSAISKVVFGGPGWMTGHPIQVIVVGQDGLVNDSVLSGYRAWVASTPAVAAALSLATMIFEGAGPLMLFGATLRRLVAAGLIAMHLNIYLVTDIVYWESMVLLAAFGLFGSPPSPRSAPVAYRPVVASGRLYAGAVVGLALCAWLAIRHQAQRFAAAPYGGASAAGQASGAAHGPPTLRQIGPLAVGQTLVDSWAIESLRLNDRGVEVAVAGLPGRVSFELTCRASEQRGPFDLDTAHLLYSSSLEMRDVSVPGGALREQLRAAAGGGDVCEHLAGWRRALAAPAAHETGGR
jgi:hypothetical protein